MTALAIEVELAPGLGVALLLAAVAVLVVVVVRLSRAQAENRRLNEDLRRKVAELEAAYARLSELDERKSDFVATASHELRTPVTSLQGFIETLLRPEVLASPEETREYLTIMRRSADRLRALIENLLLVSRIEQAGPMGNVSSLDLAALTAEILQEHRDGTRRLDLERPAGPVIVRMDRMHARTVVANLLSNASKFSPPGTPVVVAVAEREGLAELSVADRGPGVEPGEGERVFERFYRGQSSAGPTTGSGLGLYIVRRLCEAVGGTVQLDPAYRGGSRFVVRLPLADVASSPPEGPRGMAPPSAPGEQVTGR
jgi:two-component system, OmpR family, sensor kinase